MSRTRRGDTTTEIPLPVLERQWSRQDILLRERTLWRRLRLARRAQEALALNIACLHAR